MRKMLLLPSRLVCTAYKTTLAQVLLGAHGVASPSKSSVTYGNGYVGNLLSCLVDATISNVIVIERKKALCSTMREIL